MSTWYDVYCVDCKNHLGLREDGWQKQCADLIAARTALENLAPSLKVLEEGPFPYWSEVRLKMGEHNRLFAGWFAEHQGHKLAVINEYGQLYPECMKRFTCCGRCESPWHYCRRPVDHDGECSGMRDA